MREVVRELKKPRIYLTIFVGLCLLYFTAYSLSLGHLGLNESDIAGNVKAQNALKTIYWNIYNIIMISYMRINLIYPIFIITPYIYKYNKENRTNYADLLIVRMGTKKYLLERLFVGGFLGGLALSAIDILYFAFLKIFYIDAIIKFYVVPRGYFSWLFNTAPKEYLLIIWCEHFMLGFAFATLSIGICMFFKHRPLIYIVPLAFWLIYDLLIGGVLKLSDYSLDSNYMLTDNYGKNPVQLVILCFAFIFMGCLCAYIKYRRRNVYGK